MCGCGRRGRKEWIKRQEARSTRLDDCFLWRGGEGRETGEAIVVSTGPADCESVWGEGRAGNQTKAVSFLLQWEGFAPVKGLKRNLQDNWVVPSKRKQNKTKAGDQGRRGAGRDRRGERKGGNSYVLIHLFGEEFVQLFPHL